VALEPLKNKTHILFSIIVLLMAFSFMALQSTIANVFDFNQVALSSDYTTDTKEGDTEKEFDEDDLEYYFISFLHPKFIRSNSGRLMLFNNTLLPTIFYDPLLLPPEL
jgi:hypothetical protein